MFTSATTGIIWTAPSANGTAGRPRLCPRTSPPALTDARLRHRSRPRNSRAATALVWDTRDGTAPGSPPCRFPAAMTFRSSLSPSRDKADARPGRPDQIVQHARHRARSHPARPAASTATAQFCLPRCCRLMSPQKWTATRSCWASPACPSTRRATTRRKPVSDADSNHALSFLYPAVKAGLPNVVSCSGQTITLPGGKYQAIHLLAAATTAHQSPSTSMPSTAARPRPCPSPSPIGAPRRGSRLHRVLPLHSAGSKPGPTTSATTAWCWTPPKS